PTRPIAGRLVTVAYPSGVFLLLSQLPTLARVPAALVELDRLGRSLVKGGVRGTVALGVIVVCAGVHPLHDTRERVAVEQVVHGHPVGARRLQLLLGRRPALEDLEAPPEPVPAPDHAHRATRLLRDPRRPDPGLEVLVEVRGDAVEDRARCQVEEPTPLDQL